MADNWNEKWNEIIAAQNNNPNYDIYCQLDNQKITFNIAKTYLSDCKKIEDWGCGPLCYFKKFIDPSIEYLGIDGSLSIDSIKSDLINYTSNVEGILMRHILEHNELDKWSIILTNALNSFTYKMCLILFTPFENDTKILYRNASCYNYVPTISFNKHEIIQLIVSNNCSFELIENIKTNTEFGIEHVFLIKKLVK